MFLKTLMIINRKVFTNSLKKSRSLNKKFHTMKLREEKMKCVLRPGVSILSDLFTENGFELRFVGGAVRDLLMDIIPTDLDFATTATWDEMKQMFETKNIRMIHLAGEQHGTITARIEENNFECTTLQSDVREGDEVHSKWKLDAGRRDFTINALFLGFDGVVYDYFDGVQHLKNRKVIFVRNPDDRIQENYVRILRYFRFFGQIASDPDEHDQGTIDSIQRNCKGLSKISGESIWSEVKKIIGGKFGKELLIKMVECDVGVNIGLPKYFDCENYDKIHKQLTLLFKNSDLHPCTLFASGFTNVEEVSYFVDRLKCSNKEKDILLYIIKNRRSCSDIKSIKTIQDLLVDLVYKEKKTKAVALFIVSELVKYFGRTDLLAEINTELIPYFPIKRGMLVDVVANRRRIQVEMKILFEVWKESNYSLGKEELINKLKT